MHPLAYALPLATTLICFPLFAATVYRCEDSQGQITFTHLGCSTEQVQHQFETPQASTPSAAADEGPPAQKPNAKPVRKTEKPKEQAQAILGIGQRQDGCGNRVTASMRRQAMIEKEVRSGMTRADVESMLGRPDTVSSQNGRVRYNYVDKHDKGRKRSVSFDEAGCVEGKP